MFYPRNPILVIKDIFYFLHPTHQIYGITPGMRYEIAIVALLSGWYVYIKTGKMIKSILASVCGFVIILFIGFIVPCCSQLYENGINFKDDFLLSQSTFLHTGNILERSTQKISILYCILIFCLMSVAYFIYNKIKFIALISNIRVTRCIHYLLLFLTGFLFVVYCFPNTEETNFMIKSIVPQNPFEFLGLLMGALSILLSFQSAVIFNDIYDYKIDKISNKKRPLITGVFLIDDYKNIGKLLLLMAIVISICINEAFFLLILAFNGLAYLYSTPPFRLRTILFLPNILLALIAVITFHAGATLLAEEFTFVVIPTRLSVMLFIGYCIVTSIKDIKDTIGDKQENIQTLLTLFGEIKGQLIIAGMISITIIVVPFILKIDGMLIISIITAILFNIILFLIKFKKEMLIFILYYSYMIILFYKILNTWNKIEILI